MTIEEMKAKKKELGYSNKELSALSGVPEVTLQKVLSGKTASPRRETLLKIARVLAADDEGLYKKGEVIRGELNDIPEIVSQSLPPTMAGDGGSAAGLYQTAPAGRSMIREGLPAYGKQQGEYTLSDYLALPDEQRVELIDGVFYDMSAPTSGHQAFAGYIHKILLDYTLANGGPCFPLVSPIDVQLDCDDRTVVQPDVLVVCDRSKFRNGRVFGAPDFLVEILSPSTRRKDMYLKLQKYKNAGVREYWMIDQEKKVVVVYDLEREEPPALYGFGDKVPVRIWEGKCEIDFAEIYPRIEFLYE